MKLGSSHTILVGFINWKKSSLLTNNSSVMVTCANLSEQLLADDNIPRVVRDSKLDGYY